MLRIFPLFLLILMSYVGYGQGQLNWKKLKKLAEQQYEAGQYEQAAMNFEKAWQQRPQNEELIFKVGECYALLKDFKNAAQAYKNVKAHNDQFELVGLKYARALKQDGQYELAKKEFVYFMTAYQGENKSLLTQIVNTEIKGCDWGIQLAAAKAPSAIEVKHLTENINSLKTEFAPIPFAEDLLYFSSTIKDDKAYLYRSQKQKGNWTKSVAAANLPDLPNKHLANGSFTPDAKRFYFTFCNATTTGLSSVCEIYMIKRVGASWSAPVRLRDYINEAGSTTTQPWVTHKDGKEILYFASDRTGGKGGMDIWYSTREITSGDIDFTYPVNLGKQVNTIGDEMTPFYDEVDGLLYFSSNGRISLGGWDIFKIKGSEAKWEQAENMGAPINSSADDFYYVLKPSRSGGFLVSNRSAGPEKVSTQHEDIFEFGKKNKQQTYYVKGEVMEKESTADINDAIISLYEITGTRERLLQTKKSTANNYQFPILANRNYRLTIEKKGYLKNIFNFNTFQGKQNATHDFYLSKYVPKPPVVVKNQRSASDYTASNNSNVIIQKPSAIRSNAATKANDTSSKGVYYKVQLIAVNHHNEEHPRYRHVKKLARLETEQVPEKKILRVLLSAFNSKSAAQVILDQAKQYGFADAFLVKYRDGERIGAIWK